MEDFNYKLTAMQYMYGGYVEVHGIRVKTYLNETKTEGIAIDEESNMIFFIQHHPTKH